jgi:hypothetical protein
VYDTSVPGGMALDVYSLGVALCELPVSQLLMIDIPFPLREIPLITIADPGLSREKVKLEVAATVGDAVVPPYRMADVSSTGVNPLEIVVTRVVVEFWVRIEVVVAEVVVIFVVVSVAMTVVVSVVVAVVI